jgi:hypothetical protein
MGRFTTAMAADVTRSRWVAAFILAVASDAISFAASFSVFLQLGVDVATALLIWTVLGWRWILLVPMILEALPGVSMFPTWTIVPIVLKGAGKFVGEKAETSD